MNITLDKRGDLIGFKKVTNSAGNATFILKLRIPISAALRGQPQRKMRADRAYVIGYVQCGKTGYNSHGNRTPAPLIGAWHDKSKRVFQSFHDPYFKYKVEPKTMIFPVKDGNGKPFDTSDATCSGGIHFYLTLRQALLH